MTPIFKRMLSGLACLLPALAAARPLPEIVESGEFIICAAPDEMPFSAQGAPPRGLYVDLGRVVAEDLGLSLAVRWVARREAVRRVTCDAVMGAAVLGARAPSGRSSWRSVLTAPYMRAGAVMIAGPGAAGVGTLGGFRSRRVAVPSGSWAHKYLNERAIPVWVRFRTDPAIIDAVARGEADGGVVSDLAIGWHHQRHGERGIKVLDTLLDPEEFGFDVAVSLLDTDQAALDRVNAILDARLRDGTIAAIGQRYGGYRPPSSLR